MQNEVIKLVDIKETVNEYGDIIQKESIKEVFAELKSVGYSEFYQAKAAGLKPEIRFVIADYMDYSNEQVIRYAQYGGMEEDYSVIRTYRTGNELEIVCKRGID